MNLFLLSALLKFSMAPDWPAAVVVLALAVLRGFIFYFDPEKPRDASEFETLSNKVGDLDAALRALRVKIGLSRN